MTEEQTRRGLAAGVGAFLIWGLMPLYLHLFDGIPAEDVLAHRIVWSFLLTCLAAFAIRGLPRLRAALGQPRLLLMLAASGALIGGNWLIYTWAVLNGRALEASLGYFMQPLLNVALGVVLLKEPFEKPKRIAVALAATGVGIVTIAHGTVPWVSIGLAVSFGLYGLIRKHTPVDPVTGLIVETGVVSPIAIGWLVLAAEPLFHYGAVTDMALIGQSVVSVVPLGLFGYAALRLRLSTLGLLQYLAPSLVFLIAVFIFGEPLDIWRLTAFGFIWAGLLVFSIGGLRAATNPARP